jgi:subfamily B ATP-binding cassette protein MsbA
MMNVRPVVFILPMSLSFIAACFEGVFVGLFYPLTKGAIHRDFSVIDNIPIMGKITAVLPETLRSSNFFLLILIISMIFIAMLGKIIMRYFAGLILANYMGKYAHNLRTEVFKRYLKFGKLFFDRTSNAHLNTVLLHFTGSIPRQLSALQGAATSIFTLTIYITLMVMISWQLTIVLLLGFPVLNFAVKYFIARIRRISQTQVNWSLELNRKTLDALMCIPLVKVYAREEAEHERFKTLSDMSRRTAFNMQKVRALMGPTQEILMTSIVLVLLASIILVIMRSEIKDVSKYLVFFILVRRTAGHMGFFNNKSGKFSMMRENFLSLTGNGIFTDCSAKSN